MSDQQIDSGKRTWIIASSCAGVVGAGFAAVPFVSSFAPSERARAAGAAVEVDVGGLKPGEKMTVEWRGKPVWVIKRTPEQLAELSKVDGELADPKSLRKPDELTPEYARNEYRSRKPELLVVVGICTHLGRRALRASPSQGRPVSERVGGSSRGVPWHSCRSWCPRYASFGLVALSCEIRGVGIRRAAETRNPSAPPCSAMGGVNLVKHPT